MIKFRVFLFKQLHNILEFKGWRETCDTINSALKSSIQITAETVEKP